MTPPTNPHIGTEARNHQLCVTKWSRKQENKHWIKGAPSPAPLFNVEGGGGGGLF